VVPPLISKAHLKSYRLGLHSKCLAARSSLLYDVIVGHEMKLTGSVRKNEATKHVFL